MSEPWNQSPTNDPNSPSQPNGYGQPQTPTPYGQPNAAPGYASSNDPYQQTSTPGYGQQPGLTYGQQPAQPYGQQMGQPYGAPAPYGYGAAGPRPSMKFGQAIKAYFQNYVKFDGRASLSEFWWIVLFYLIIGGVLSTLLLTVGMHAATYAADGTMISAGGFNGLGMLLSSLLSLFELATLVPSLGLAVRRLHDSNRSGWLLLLGLIPGIGGIILLVFYCMGSNPQGARFDGAEQPKTGN